MIDALDQKLILELQKEGRKGYVDLASELGVVEGTVRKRVKRLLDRDVIKIVGVPNLRSLGYGFVSIMGLQVSVADLRRVATNLARNQHVCFLAFVSGRYDLIAIIVTHSQEEYSRFWESELSTIPGILRTEGLVNLDIIKGSASLLDTIGLVRDLDISSVSKT